MEDVLHRKNKHMNTFFRQKLTNKTIDLLEKVEDRKTREEEEDCLILESPTILAIISLPALIILGIIVPIIAIREGDYIWGIIGMIIFGGMCSWLTGYALFWRVIVDHEKVRYHSLFFGIGRSYPLKAITRVCRDEVYCLNIYKGKRKVITVDDEIEGIPYLMKWFANEGILVEDLKPGPEYYKVMEYPIHNWLMSAFEAFLALPLLGLWIYLLYKDGEIQGGMEILGVILATILLVGINIIMILGIIYNKVFYLKYQNGIYRYKKLFHEEEILKLDKTLSYKVDWDEGNIILYRDRKRLFTLHKGMANVRQFVVDTLLESDIPCIEGEKYLETFWRKKL